MGLLSSCLVFIYLLLSKKQNTKTNVLSYSTKGALTKFNKDNIGETLLEETGLNIE